LAGWAALLSRLSGQKDVVIGTPVTNRGRAEIERLIGCFVNTLALRIDLSGKPSVAELLERVKSRVLEGQEHQDIPFEQVVELVRPVRSPSHSPLFQVGFAWQPGAEEKFRLPGLEKRNFTSKSPHVLAKFDLTLSFKDLDRRIVGGVEYATSLFEPSTIERYLRYFRKLLEGMVVQETQTVDRLPLLSAAERQKVVEGWNATRVE